MYKRAGYHLFNVTRHLSKNLHNNARDNNLLALFVKPNENVHVLTNAIFRRHYSDEINDDPVPDHQFIRDPDAVAKIRLEKFVADPENQKKLQRIELETEIRRQNGEKVPEVMKARIWWELVNLKSYNMRRRYLEFCWRTDMKKANIKEKKLEKKLSDLERPLPTTEYRLGRNTMFLRFYPGIINHFYNGRVMNALMFGQPIVFDCGYGEHMSRLEAKYCARQLSFAYSENRVHDNPFNMYFCNTDFNSLTMECLYRLLPNMLDADFPINVKKESYLELFDRDRLVYLSPHATEMMEELDSNAVYIIGAYVDKSKDEPVSMAKAKRDGIKCQRLPLERYLQWGTSSSKNLTLNAVLNILLDLKKTNNWTKALEKNVPMRKLHAARQAAENRALQRVFKREGIDDNITDFSMSKFKNNFRAKFNHIVQERNSNYTKHHRTEPNFINESNYENKNLRPSSYAAFRKK